MQSVLSKSDNPTKLHRATHFVQKKKREREKNYCFLIKKTSLDLIFCDCGLPSPGRNSEEYLNGKVPLIGCFGSRFDDCLFMTFTRRIVSSLVVDDDDDDDEFNRGLFEGSTGIACLAVFRVR